MDNFSSKLDLPRELEIVESMDANHMQMASVNGDAAESYRGQSVDEKSLFCSINEGVSYLYLSAAEPAMCNHHLGLLFHMR